MATKGLRTDTPTKTLGKSEFENFQLNTAQDIEEFYTLFFENLNYFKRILSDAINQILAKYASNKEVKATPSSSVKEAATKTLANFIEAVGFEFFIRCDDILDDCLNQQQKEQLAQQFLTPAKLNAFLHANQQNTIAKCLENLIRSRNFLTGAHFIEACHYISKKVINNEDAVIFENYLRNSYDSPLQALNQTLKPENYKKLTAEQQNKLADICENPFFENLIHFPTTKSFKDLRTSEQKQAHQSRQKKSTQRIIDRAADIHVTKTIPEVSLGWEGWKTVFGRFFNGEFNIFKVIDDEKTRKFVDNTSWRDGERDNDSSAPRRRGPKESHHYDQAIFDVIVRKRKYAAYLHHQPFLDINFVLKRWLQEQDADNKAALLSKGIMSVGDINPEMWQELGGFNGLLNLIEQPYLALHHKNRFIEQINKHLSALLIYLSTDGNQDTELTKAAKLWNPTLHDNQATRKSFERSSIGTTNRAAIFSVSAEVQTLTPITPAAWDQINIPVVIQLAENSGRAKQFFINEFRQKISKEEKPVILIKIVDALRSQDRRSSKLKSDTSGVIFTILGEVLTPAISSLFQTFDKDNNLFVKLASVLLDRISRISDLTTTEIIETIRIISYLPNHLANEFIEEIHNKIMEENGFKVFDQLISILPKQNDLYKVLVNIFRFEKSEFKSTSNEEKGNGSLADYIASKLEKISSLDAKQLTHIFKLILTLPEELQQTFIHSIQNTLISNSSFFENFFQLFPEDKDKISHNLRNLMIRIWVAESPEIQHDNSSPSNVETKNDEMTAESKTDTSITPFKMKKQFSGLRLNKHAKTVENLTSAIETYCNPNNIKNEDFTNILKLLSVLPDNLKRKLVEQIRRQILADKDHTILTNIFIVLSEESANKEITKIILEIFTNISQTPQTESKDDVLNLQNRANQDEENTKLAGLLQNYEHEGSDNDESDNDEPSVTGGYSKLLTIITERCHQINSLSIDELSQTLTIISQLPAQLAQPFIETIKNVVSTEQKPALATKILQTLTISNAPINRLIQIIFRNEYKLLNTIKAVWDKKIDAAVVFTAFETAQLLNAVGLLPKNLQKDFLKKIQLILLKDKPSLSIENIFLCFPHDDKNNNLKQLILNIFKLKPNDYKLTIPQASLTVFLCKQCSKFVSLSKFEITKTLKFIIELPRTLKENFVDKLRIELLEKGDVLLAQKLIQEFTTVGNPELANILFGVFRVNSDDHIEITPETQKFITALELHCRQFTSFDHAGISQILSLLSYLPENVRQTSIHVIRQEIANSNQSNHLEKIMDELPLKGKNICLEKVILEIFGNNYQPTEIKTTENNLSLDTKQDQNNKQQPPSQDDLSQKIFRLFSHLTGPKRAQANILIDQQVRERCKNLNSCGEKELAQILILANYTNKDLKNHVVQKLRDLILQEKTLKFLEKIINIFPATGNKILADTIFEVFHGILPTQQFSTPTYKDLKNITKQQQITDENNLQILKKLKQVNPTNKPAFIKFLQALHQHCKDVTDKNNQNKSNHNLNSRKITVLGKIASTALQLYLPLDRQQGDSTIHLIKLSSSTPAIPAEQKQNGQITVQNFTAPISQNKVTTAGKTVTESKSDTHASANRNDGSKTQEPAATVLYATVQQALTASITDVPRTQARATDSNEGQIATCVPN